MSSLLDKFTKFLKDPEEANFYLTGVAGTGKTTSLAELVQFCIENKIKYVVTAYTHKACSILASKMPAETSISTLHSFLVKRPTINVNAKELKQVDGNAQMNKPEEVRVLFIDEFSMVGDKDYTSIADLQYDEDGSIKTQVVYIGDPNQLPPVKDIAVVTPSGEYWVKLDKVYRQAGDNQLIDNLLAINDYINGEEPAALVEHDNFIRGIDLVSEYRACNDDKIILAYTNERVQLLNAEIMDREEPIENDMLYTPTTRKTYSLIVQDTEANGIITINGSLLELESKYKTLETLHEIKEVQFFTVADIQGNESCIAAVFGHHTFLQVQQQLANEAVKINKEIASKFNMDANKWSKLNWSNPLAKTRGKAWGKYLAFKDNVHCLDFNHAMTVHKSQGSTYNTVFIDTEDLSRCAAKDYTMYLKLLYVAISRASSKVYTN